MVIVIVFASVFVPFLVLRTMLSKCRVWSITDGVALSLAAVFMVTGVSHFLMVDGMVKMVPPFIPFPEMVIYLSGVAELVLVVLLVWRKHRKIGAFCTIALLMTLLPANVYASVNYVDFGGNSAGPSYLWFRIPLQGALIWLGWVVYKGRKGYELKK